MRAFSLFGDDEGDHPTPIAFHSESGQKPHDAAKTFWESVRKSLETPPAGFSLGKGMQPPVPSAYDTEELRRFATDVAEAIVVGRIDQVRVPMYLDLKGCETPGDVIRSNPGVALVGHDVQVPPRSPEALRIVWLEACKQSSVEVPSLPEWRAKRLERTIDGWLADLPASAEAVVPLLTVAQLQPFAALYTEAVREVDERSLTRAQARLDAWLAAPAPWTVASQLTELSVFFEVAARDVKAHVGRRTLQEQTGPKQAEHRDRPVNLPPNLTFESAPETRVRRARSGASDPDAWRAR